MILVLLAATLLLIDDGQLVKSVTEISIRDATDKINGIADAQVDEGLREIVERLRLPGHNDNDFPSPVAYRLTYGLAFRCIFYKPAIVDKRILAEEIASGLGRFLKER